MNIERIDLNLLVYLDVLLRERNVTRAASYLGITQPAMSNGLRRLRELFDDPLLVRTSEGMTPTERALELQPVVRSVLAAEAVAFPSSGELHIGVEAITAPLMRIPTDWRWSSVAAGASNDGTLGWTTGNVDAVRHAAGRDAVTIQSKYVAFWKKVDGSWKMIMLGTMPRAAGTN